VRDPKKLKAFHMADALVLKVYEATQAFPPEEHYGLAAQIRKSAVSVASNLVEGCARKSEADFLRFLDIAYGSACELEYQLSLAHRPGWLSDTDSLSEPATQLSKVLHGLRRSLSPDTSLEKP